MPEQELDAPPVDSRFEYVRSEGMPEYVRVDRLRQVCGLPSVPADVIHRACRHGARSGVAGKEPGARLRLLPILP